MNEDYDTAKAIKVEIDRQRQGISNPWIEELIAEHLGVPPKAATPSQMRHTGNQFSQFSQSSQNFAREQQMRAANRMEEEPPQTNVKARMMATGGSL